MFGYVNIYRDELKVKDYETFRAYYCGLCEAIGRYGSQTARLGLSYDMAFLAVLLSAVEESETQFTPRRCIVHPGMKRKRAGETRGIVYAAKMSVLLGYLKFADDWHDDKSPKAAAGMLAYRRAVKRAEEGCAEEYEFIRRMLKEQSRIEEEGCRDIDLAADPFANILKTLFAPPYITDMAMRRTLEWMGYNTGRWIYITDAFCDMEKDMETKSYNPFLAAMEPGREFPEYKSELKKKLSFMQTYTLSEIAAAYELLDIKRNKAILDNIIYIGLKAKQDAILGEQGGQDESV